MRLLKIANIDVGGEAVIIPRGMKRTFTAATAPTEAKSSPSASHEILGIIYISLYAFWRALCFVGKTIFRYVHHHPFHAMFNLIVLLGVALVIVTGSEIHKQLILSRISDQTIDKIITGSRFTRNFNSVAASREGTREFVGVGAPKWVQKESIRAILYHARKAGLSVEDQVVLLATADIESGFNPLARASSTSACGLFQFVQRTGQMFDLEPTDCMDPWSNARSGVEHYMKNIEQAISPKVKDLTGVERAFKTFELSYYLHHDGPNSTNPSNDVKALVLGGSQFLFSAYNILKNEAESEKNAPTFGQIFSQNLLKLFDEIYSTVVPSAIAAEPELAKQKAT